MILIDICIPVLNKTYDFEVNEEESIQTLTADIIAMIRIMENVTEEGELFLVDPDKGKILNGKWNLKEQGIENGAKLILI